MKQPESMPEGAGHRARLRQKFKNGGLDAFLEYELLELLLTYALPRRDVKPLAKKLLEKYHTVAGVFDARLEELAEFEGLTEYSAVLFKLTRDLSCYYLKSSLAEQPYLRNMSSFIDYARAKLGEYRTETLMAFFLNTKNMLIDVRILSEGSVDCVNVFPSVLAKEMLLHDAKNLVICHNHPGGSARPSREDTEVTRRIQAALRPIDAYLLDHIIVSRTSYYSYRQEDRTQPGKARVLDPYPGLSGGESN